ncbi:MAG: prepilin peptidase [Patescibacteria group bacterium]
MNVLPLSWVLFFLGLMGLILGSFGNVLIARAPKGESIGGRSRCPHCKNVLGWGELVPVISFLLHGGRCRKCRKGISAQYPFVEIVSALIVPLAFYRGGFQVLPSVLLSLSLWFLFLIAVTDFQTRTIPDALSLPLIALTLLWNIADGRLHAEGLVVGAVFIGGQWLLSKGKWVGSGDVLLALGIGALMQSWVLGILWLGLSYMIGAVLACILLLTHKKTAAESIAFAPLLVAGAFITLFWGEEILSVWFPF